MTSPSDLIRNAALRYMNAVKALGEFSGYNAMTYFECPILKVPYHIGERATARWLELNDSGVALSAALALPRSPGEPVACPDGWKPIETAPKDRSVIIVSEKGAVGEAQWEEGAGWYWAGHHSTDHYGYQIWPTHWQPLPAPPSFENSADNKGIST